MPTIRFLIATTFLFGSCRSYPPLETVDQIDLDKYIGKWYEIARYPNRFQKNCTCTTAEYKISKKGYIEVTNRCIKNEKEDKATGKAFIVKGTNNTKLKVQFQWPFKGNYWIIDCASDYNYAVVSGPSRKYLWILNRKSQMKNATYDKILATLRTKGFKTEKLIKNEKVCN